MDDDRCLRALIGRCRIDSGRNPVAQSTSARARRPWPPSVDRASRCAGRGYSTWSANVSADHSSAGSTHGDRYDIAAQGGLTSLSQSGGCRFESCRRSLGFGEAQLAEHSSARPTSSRFTSPGPVRAPPRTRDAKAHPMAKFNIVDRRRFDRNCPLGTEQVATIRTHEGAPAYAREKRAVPAGDDELRRRSAISAPS